MEKRPKLFVLADVPRPQYGATGGAFRSAKSIREYQKYFDVHVILPPNYVDVNPDKLREELEVQGVKLLTSRVGPILASRRLNLSFIYVLLPRIVLKHTLKGIKEMKVAPEAVVVLNELFEHLAIGRLLKEEYRVPAMALLQLPLFYHDKRRRKNIAKALELWYHELYRGEHVAKLVGLLISWLDFRVKHSSYTRKLLESYDLLVAVSKSILIEMGTEWQSRIYVLDPGVAFDEKDLEQLIEIKGTAKKRDYIVLGGRVDPIKGFIEALYAFKQIVRNYSSIRLFVTSYIRPRLKTRVERLVKKLELEGKVVITGLLPREERLGVVASAKLTLYPSHVDAYPYAVAESLYLGTPVVGYDIPALRIYHGENPGVKLVEEGDVEALASEALNVLESKDIVVERPRTRRWEEIISEEIELIFKLLEKRPRY